MKGIHFCVLLLILSLASVQANDVCTTGGSKLTGGSGLDLIVGVNQVKYIDSDFVAKSILVLGKLYFKNNNINVDVNWIRVNNGGSLQIGHRTCPIQKKIKITFHGPRDNTSTDMGSDPADNANLGGKGLSVATGGKLDIYGKYNAKPWTNLFNNVEPNSLSFVVKEPTSWKVGDKIVLTSTDYADDSYVDLKQDEERQISAIETITCPGTTNQMCDRVTVSQAIQYLHYGGPEYQGEVGHLTRNILIKGDDSSVQSLFGAHIIIRKVEHAVFHGLELENVGQQGVVGRYAIHFHQLGFSAQGNQVSVEKCAIHKAFQRAVVIHDSHHITVKDNVAFDVSGSCYFLEDGSETNNQFIGNLGAYVHDVPAGPMQIIPSDSEASVYWIPNPSNVFEGNVACGGTFGFWFVMPTKPNGLSTAKYASDDNFHPRLMPLSKFDNNVAHSARKTGVMVDEFQNMDGTIGDGSYTPKQGPYVGKINDLPAITAHFKNVTAYKNRKHGFWARGSDMRFSGFKLFDNLRGFQAVVMPGLIEDSLFVCETNNIGTPVQRNGLDPMPRSRPYIWSNTAPVWGYEHYDASGGQFQRNNVFKNCISNNFRKAAAMGSLRNGPNVIAPMNRMSRLAFQNSQVFYWERFPNSDRSYKETDHSKFLMVLDNDGTSTGNMGTWVVPRESFHTYGIAGCVNKTSDQVNLCPPTYNGFAFLEIENKDTSKTDFNGTNTSKDNPWIRVTWIHFGDSNEQHSLGSPGNDAKSKTRRKYRANIAARRGYAVRFPHPTPPFLNLRARGLAYEDFVVVCLPFPDANDISVKRTAWPQNTFTRVNSLADLAKDTYTFYQNQLCVRVQKPTDDSSKIKDGFVYQESWNAQVEIKHTCRRSGCAVPRPPVPPTLPSSESMFRTDLCSVNNVQSKSYGTAFFGYNPNTKLLSYQIYHGLDKDATVAHLHRKSDGKTMVSLGSALSPMEGAVLMSYRNYVALFKGELYLNIHTTKNPSGELQGDVGCSSPNANCVSPPRISAQLPCSIADNDDGKVVSKDGQLKSANWVSWSWGGSHGITITANSNDKACGQASMQINTRDGALSPHSSQGLVVPSNYFFQFWVKSQSGPIVLAVGLYDTSKWLPQVKTTSNYVNHWEINNEEWTRVKIPVSDLGITTDTLINRFKIQIADSWKLAENKQFLLNDIRFAPPVSDPLAPLITNSPAYVPKSCKVDPSGLVQPIAPPPPPQVAPVRIKINLDVPIDHQTLKTTVANALGLSPSAIDIIN